MLYWLCISGRGGRGDPGKGVGVLSVHPPAGFKLGQPMSVSHPGQGVKHMNVSHLGFNSLWASVAKRFYMMKKV